MNPDRRLGLADAIGITVSLTIIAVWAALPDPVNHIKLAALVLGSAAMLPFVVLRLVTQVRDGSTRPLTPWILRGAALAFVVWGAVSAVGSDATWQDSVIGAWGRNAGLLALTSAVVIFIGATTLRRFEVERVLSWLLAVAVIEVIVGTLQWFLPNPLPAAQTAAGSITGTVGNTNFAAGLFSILLVVALGRLCARRTSPFQRGLTLVLVPALAILTWGTGASQAVLATGAGVSVFVVALALAYRGPRRVVGLVAAAAVAIAAVTGVILAAVGSPLLNLRADSGFEIRVEYWKATWATFVHQPLLGTGPDGLKRVMGEYRPDSYVALLGEENKLDAAHNIALHFAATLGIVGVVLWLMVMIGALVVLGRRIVIGPVASPALAASLAGAFAAYLAQGSVSVDVLPLLAVGWLVAGLAAAYSDARVSSDVGEPGNSGAAMLRGRAHPRSRRSRELEQTTNVVAVRPLIIATAIAGVLVAGAGWLLFAFTTTAAQTSGRVDPEFALVAITDPMTTCQSRSGLVQAAIATMPANEVIGAVEQATDIDPRCGFMIHFQSELAINTGDLALADESTRMGIEFDPLLPVSWVLRGIYLVNRQDLAGAERALAEAERVAALSPEVGSAEGQVEILRQRVADLRASSAAAP